MKHHFLRTAFFFLAAMSATAQPVLVKDIYPGQSSSTFAGLEKTAVAGNTFYFVANDGVHGDELWKSDGTAAGTVLVRDIFPGTNQAAPRQLFTAFEGHLYFEGYQPATGSELWRTVDGPDGAVLLSDACPGDCDGAGWFEPNPMAVFQDKLYTRYYSIAVGHELWVTDGTEAGTTLVKNINPGGSESMPHHLTVFQDKLFFVADSANWGRELWVSDGTGTGTRPLKNINPITFFGQGGSEIDALVPGFDAIYFWANDKTMGKELWKSDGTGAGTVLVKDIRPGSGNGAPDNIPLSSSLLLGNQLLFIANDSIHGPELWATDGTENGTILVKDINPGTGSSSITFFAVVQGKALFKANDGTNGSELWSTDGTEAGTTMLKEVLPGAGGGVSDASVLFQNLLLFTANDGVHGKELWVSDGTADGTTLLADILLGTSESNPLGYRIIGNTLFFYATTNATGRELWKYDLTPLGTQDIRNGLGIKVWPTASADGQFHITLDGREEPLRIEAFDVLGRLRTWRTLQPGTEILDLSALPVGAYLLRMTGMNSGRGAIERVFVVR
jgi:ELWxxDGT repeat protein